MAPDPAGLRRPPASDAEVYDRARSAGYLVSLASRLFAGVLRDRLSDFGVTPAQVPVILWLREQDGLTQKALSEKASIEQPSAAEMLARMEKVGLVTRTRDADDRRRWRYHLTARARELVGALTADAAFGNRVALSGLSEAEVDAFLATLNHVIDNLRRCGGGTPFTAGGKKDRAVA